MRLRARFKRKVCTVHQSQRSTVTMAMKQTVICTRPITDYAYDFKFPSFILYLKKLSLFVINKKGGCNSILDLTGVSIKLTSD